MNQRLSDIYLKSLKEPENFWREIANDIFWFKKPTKILNKSNPDLIVLTRWSKGEDINAACGQLATKNES